MKVWHSSSTERRPCVMCGYKTGTYKVFEQCGMEIRIPLCDSVERPSCYSKVEVKEMAAGFLTALKKAVQVSP